MKENGKLLVGVGIGSTRVKVVTVSNGDFANPSVSSRDHLGNPRDVTVLMLGEIDPAGVAGLAVTGGEAASMVRGRKTYECEAIEESLRLLGLGADAVLSLGGESFVAYPVDGEGRVLDYVAGNRCAAGTVEFFKQQLGRMNLSVKEGTNLARSGKLVPLAKRCSVHCKSDCTHALNKNRCTVADIAHTLCHNMAEKAVGLLHKCDKARGRILVIGGAANNPVIIEYVGKLLPGCEVSVPPHAAHFEALGAASLARTRSISIPASWPEMFSEARSSFALLEPLPAFAHMVSFLPSLREKARLGRRYLLGIDGGSTTTKAALVDADSLRICAAHYTRTNGNPEKAMKECLAAVREQVAADTGETDIEIEGVATTGSSGEILSVLCETPAYHNEIIAHAYGASHFCPDVDTILEIGGQDSKFTRLKSRVAIDFNMNESCSAGTGSFIEESAKDDLGVPMERIAELAIKSERPPRFSDQCAAFANTDIRKASQEGAGVEDNLAGLVYAIVENYMTKVVGERRTGNHILFQGGTSKNKAIAFAFAAKTGKHITVPPDSELIGCFGIALWLREKMRSGEIPEGRRRLEELLLSSATDKQEFTCKSCENYCSIQNLTINGRKYPFGGQCSKWENARARKSYDIEEFDLISKRNRMLFSEYGVPPSVEVKAGTKTMGIQAAFTAYWLYPLYSHFFRELGYSVVLSENVDPHGVRMCQSSRCYPYEIAHGTFHDLVVRGVKDIFVPHLVTMPLDHGASNSVACPIAQAAPYYIAAAFPRSGVRIHSPVVNMSGGIRDAAETFIALAVSLGHGADEAARAFEKACEAQDNFEKALKEEGRKTLDELEKKDRIGVVLVGRPYNAFAKCANMGVPRKFASRGVAIIPYDFLPVEDEPTIPTMYWKYGQSILKSLRYVRKHPRLFPVFISNFGCGPDSFIQHFAMSAMGRKPLLYLELDSHTADAGIGTRVAAFLDIVEGYRGLGDVPEPASDFKQAEHFVRDGVSLVRTSSGELLPLNDPRVKVVFPSMGAMHTEAGAAAIATVGLRGLAMPPVDDRVLAVGRAYTSGKECSPAVFTVGSLVTYCRERHKKERADEVTVFFMPTTTGPCRFGQYNVYMKSIIESLRLQDVAIMSPSAADNYGGLGFRFLAAGWRAFVIADLMRDVKALLAAAAADPAAAMAVFDEEWLRVLRGIGAKPRICWRQLAAAARNLSRIPLKSDPACVPKVLLTGEIYVRSDELSRRRIDDSYAGEGIMLKTADSSEWIYYTTWMHMYKLAGKDGFPADLLGILPFLANLKRAVFRRDRSARKFLAARLLLSYQTSVERKARRILGRSGLLATRPHAIDDVVRTGAEFVNPALMGEAILTAGSAKLVFEHPEDNYCGAVFIGPFNCMPTGIAESVFKPAARAMGIPLLVFETDGGPLTPNFKSQLEVHLARSKAFAVERERQSQQDHPTNAARPPVDRVDDGPCQVTSGTHEVNVD